MTKVKSVLTLYFISWPSSGISSCTLEIVLLQNNPQIICMFVLFMNIVIAYQSWLITPQTSFSLCIKW